VAHPLVDALLDVCVQPLEDVGGDGELDVQVQTRESAAERFTSIWSDIREA
jgi:hypothetical protein